MSRRTLLLIIFIVVLFYPLYTAFQLEQVIEAEQSLEKVRSSLKGYQASAWITWVVLVSIAVYYKWTQKKNFFFFLTYGFLAIAFGIFGSFAQAVVNNFNLPSSFEDGYTYGILSAVQNIFVAAILTGFLQAAVWWFTRRWHRRYR